MTIQGSIIATKQQLQNATSKNAAPGVVIKTNPRTNQLILVGTPDDLDAAELLAASLDVSLGLSTRIYTFTSASPDRVDRLVVQLIGDATSKRLYQSSVDSEANLLIVTTTDAIHSKSNHSKTISTKTFPNHKTSFNFTNSKTPWPIRFLPRSKQSSPTAALSA